MGTGAKVCNITLVASRKALICQKLWQKPALRLGGKGPILVPEAMLFKFILSVKLSQCVKDLVIRNFIYFGTVSADSNYFLPMHSSVNSASCILRSFLVKH